MLSVTPASLELTAAASTATLTIANTGTGTMSWTAAESLSWLSISPDSVTGTVTVTYQANETGASRTGTITVTASGATGSPKSISVTQGAAGQERHAGIA